jgi:hypothetical protein
MKALGGSKSANTLRLPGWLSGSPGLTHLRAILHISRNLLRLQHFQ